MITADNATMIADGFMRGWLYVEIDEQSTSRLARISPFVDEDNTARDATLRWVHVISKYAGGEIRGYALINGELRERGPRYMDWPELDAAVSARTGYPIYQRGAR